MNTDAECNFPIPPVHTGKTITHRGRDYAVLLLDKSLIKYEFESGYVLRNARGRCWSLLRNKPNPKMLFAIPFDDGMKVMPGWFTDRTGELASCG